MGMYTQLSMNFTLREDTPLEMIEVLKEMCDGQSDYWVDSLSRLNWCFKSSSYYFENTSNSFIRYDERMEQYRVMIHCDFKNYNGEIKEFIEWIMPYIDAEEGRFIGYSRYEEKLAPTLYFKES